MPKHPLGGMRWDAEVTGSKATMSCANYGVPHNGNFIIVQDADGRTVVVTCSVGKTVGAVGFIFDKAKVEPFVLHDRERIAQRNRRQWWILHL